MTSEFLLPDGVTLAQAGARLAAGLCLREGVLGETDRRVYDTFDGRLHAAGVFLIYASGRLALIDARSGIERVGAPQPEPPAGLLVGALAAGPLREALAPIAEMRALLLLARVHTRVRPLSVLDDAGKTVVRITLEEPGLVASGERGIALAPRVRLVPVRGYAKALERVRSTLVQKLELEPAQEPLLDAAVRANGTSPAGVSARVEVKIGFEQRADAAAAAVLARLLEIVRANLEGTIADVDPEFLHDYRVAVRRSRAVLRECKPVFPGRELAGLRAELRWLQQVTGPARDLDVYGLEFDDFRGALPEAFAADLEPLRAVLGSRRLLARREMARELRSERATELLTRWDAFVSGLATPGADEGPQASRPIGPLSGERIAKVYRRMLRMGRVIDAASPPEALHELRKEGKALRYLLELFGTALYPPDVVRPMIKTLKSLQDTLGRHQDREVQVTTLRSLSGEVSSRPGGDAALMAMGLLIERLGRDAEGARLEFGSRFATFSEKAQRALVKDTFV